MHRKMNDKISIRIEDYVHPKKIRKLGLTTYLLT